MENVLSLAYFYTTDRPWNVYRADPALRQRLQLALDYLLSLQEDSGRMRPSSPDERPTMTLGITMFFTKFTGQALVLLAGEPGIDEGLYGRVMEAQRKALMFLLRSDAAYEQGRRYSNQYGNVWAGAYAYLWLQRDPELRQALGVAIEKSRGQFQSPAGYPYENHATDFQYSLGTHHSNLDMAWHYARKLEWADTDWLVEDARGWAEWLSYNAVPEPSWDFFCLNRAIETRQDHAGFERVEVAIAEVAPVMHAFAVTQEEARLRRQRIRQVLAQDWPEVAPLKVPQYRSYTPYAFLHRDHVTWRPTQAERQEAREELPCLRADSFVHQRADSRRPFAATFIHRPGYYAAFNGGTQRNRVQIFGLGLLWHPAAGTVIQSQTRMHDAAWGVRAEDAERVQEMLRPVDAEYRVDETLISPLPGARDLPGGEFILYRFLVARSRLLWGENVHLRIG